MMKSEDCSSLKFPVFSETVNIADIEAPETKNTGKLTPKILQNCAQQILLPG